MCENSQAIYDIAYLIKDVFPLLIKFLPLMLFVPVVSVFISFIKYCCQCRRAYNHSWHVTRKLSEYPKYKFDNSDCAAWVKEFEEKEDISIYG